MISREGMSQLGWRGWSFALFKAAIGGAANAVVTSTAFTATHPGTFSHPGQWFVMVGWVFAIGSVTNAVFFLAKSPLPEFKENNEP